MDVGRAELEVAEVGWKPVVVGDEVVPLPVDAAAAEPANSIEQANLGCAGHVFTLDRAADGHNPGRTVVRSADPFIRIDPGRDPVHPD